MLGFEIIALQMGLGKLSEKATILPRNKEDKADYGRKVTEAAGADAAGLSKRVTEYGSTFRPRMEIDEGPRRSQGVSSRSVQRLSSVSP